MKINIDIQSPGGHTEIEFLDDKINLDWREAPLRERAGLFQLVQGAKDSGLKITRDEKAVDDIDEALFGASGKLTLSTAKPIDIKVLADKFITANLKCGKMVMERTENNEWRILRTMDSIGAGGDKTLVVQEKPAGG